MSATNKKSLASQALLEMETIKAALKEESKSTIRTMLNEAVKDALRDSIEEDEYEIEEEDDKAKKGTKKSVEEDGEQDMDPTAAAAAPAEGEAEPAAVGAEAPVDGAEAPADPATQSEGDWSEFDKYKVGDDTYDLTGEEDYENVVKVYKLLTNDDQVVIKKNDGKIELKDNEAGTEYVIDLGDGDEVSDEEMPGAEADAEAVEPVADVEGGEEMPQDDEALNEEIFEIDLGEEDEDNEEDVPASDIAGLNENKKNRKKTMKESKEVIFEVDLGYTDNYQDKDPIAGLSNNEPSKSGKSWHKGVPTGTEKPWAGETGGKGEPFEKQVNEEFDELEGADAVEEPVEEATNVGGAVQQRTSSKSHIPSGRKEHGPKVKRHVSAEGDYHETVNENKELKKAVKELRKSLQEAYLVNVNLGKITKLFLENTTNREEKIDIINRFNNEAKTVEQSNALFESINKQLKKAPKAEQVIENCGKASAAQPLNETKNYGQSKDVLEVIDFMNRMKNC